MIKQTLKKWQEEGIRRFGTDPAKWKFRCPACGHIASGQNFKDVGADIEDLYQTCIGRHNGKGADGMKGIDEGYGCNWAAFGLFGNLGKGRVVVTPDGKEVQVFDFA